MAPIPLGETAGELIGIRDLVIPEQVVGLVVALNCFIVEGPEGVRLVVGFLEVKLITISVRDSVRGRLVIDATGFSVGDGEISTFEVFWFGLIETSIGSE